MGIQLSAFLGGAAKGWNEAEEIKRQAAQQRWERLMKALEVKSSMAEKGIIPQAPQVNDLIDLSVPEQKYDFVNTDVNLNPADRAISNAIKEGRTGAGATEGLDLSGKPFYLDFPDETGTKTERQYFKYTPKKTGEEDKNIIPIARAKAEGWTDSDLAGAEKVVVNGIPSVKIVGYGDITPKSQSDKSTPMNWAKFKVEAKKDPVLMQGYNAGEYKVDYMPDGKTPKTVYVTYLSNKGTSGSASQKGWKESYDYHQINFLKRDPALAKSVRTRIDEGGNKITEVNDYGAEAYRRSLAEALRKAADGSLAYHNHFMEILALAKEPPSKAIIAQYPDDEAKQWTAKFAQMRNSLKASGPKATNVHLRMSLTERDKLLTLIDKKDTFDTFLNALLMPPAVPMSNTESEVAPAEPEPTVNEPGTY